MERCPMTKILAVPGEGERLDRFELVAELAAGGMATVYLARFVGVAGFKRFVAIKRLHPHLAKEQDFIQMFLDEARLAARLHHPNVVPILEIGVQNEQYYLVMEYIEGDTVGHLMARAVNVNRKIPVPIVIRILLDALTGLHAAHELTDDDGSHLEIVHRDVSPQNILVGVDGVARITDFGVAKAQARLASATQGGQLKGKLAYMSPEQVRGNMPVDRRADVFAAGIVLWELLTGQRLFKADGEAETLFKVVAAEVPPIRNFEPGVPPEVEVVVRRARAARADDRFGTAADFAEALEQAARTYDLVATVRQTAAFVNEMIGLDISQQRDIVRAWLGRSDVSRSGVGITLDRSDAPTPMAGSPAAPASDVDLDSLMDDDLEMATRVDDEEEDATRIQELPVPAASKPRLPPQPPTSSPIMSVGEPRAQYTSVPTAREFQPAGPMQPNPQLAATFLGPMQSPMPPQVAGQSGPYPPAPVAYPFTQPQPVAPAPKKGLPAWTLVIPAILIIGGAVLLGLRQRRAHPHVATPPHPTATQSAQPVTPPTQSAATAPSETPTTTASASATATAAVAPTQTATAQTADTTAPTATSTATATATGTATATATSAPVHHHAVVTHHYTYPTHKPSNAAAVDSKEFGGRD
jgi:serine/threonine protein kinase